MSEEIIQGTADWQALRIGKATASKIADIVAKTKSGPAASRTNYMAQIVAERLTGNKAESFSNAAMQWGTDQEPNARAMYAFITDADVSEVAFIDHPSIPMAGASPDGLVGDEGLVEIKAPQTATHIETLLGAPISEKYILQMQWQMACTGRAWCDFVSFDPRMPAAMQMHIQRIKRDDVLIVDLEIEVRKFLAEVTETVSALTEKYIQDAS